MASLKFDYNFLLLEECAERDVKDYPIQFLYDHFKTFRDMCVKKEGFEDNRKNKCLLRLTYRIMNNMFTHYDEKFLPPISQALQFLHNFTTQNSENQLTVWNTWKDHFRLWMKLENESIRNYTCGILYNITLERPEILLEIVKDTVLVNFIIDSAIQGTDFPILITEKLLTLLTDHAELFLDTFFRCDSCCHVEILNMLYEFVKFREVDIKFINWIKERFKSKCEGLKVGPTLAPNDIQEIFVLLKILVVCSGKEHVTSDLQNDLDLLDAAKNLLHSLHFAGLNSSNDLTPTEDIMTERTSFENLKSNLIRLVGNLCWRNKRVQNRVRESDGLPLILDCCVRDGKNPFITECVVFAIRNLCEGNPENQSFIKSMNEETHNTMSTLTQDWQSVYIPS